MVVGVIRRLLDALKKFGSTALAVPGPGGGPGRTSGPPTSSNAASSFHLYWDVPPVGLAEVGATIEVTEPPTVERLYFWALQANFVTSNGARLGGAHFGLQYHPAYPGGGAVNWGGYNASGAELDGSVSDLPSTLDNINTSDYRWASGRLYRYRIYRSPERGWRGSITDLETGMETVVRDLYIGGNRDAGNRDQIVSPMVWTECFAHCEEAPSAVRWTDLTATDLNGTVHTVDAVRINYQTQTDGGCANTNISTSDGTPAGWEQRTATERLQPTGAKLSIPKP